MRGSKRFGRVVGRLFGRAFGRAFGRVFGRAFGVALLAIAAATTPASAAGTLAVAPPSGSPGQILAAHGSGFPAGQLVTLRWDGVILPETGPSGDDGSYEITFAVPAGAAVGGHELRACVGVDCSLAPPFTVAVVVAPPSSNPTPAPSEPAGSATPSESLAGSAGPGESPIASDGATPSDGLSPAPDPSASGAVAAPSLAPTVIPSDPDAPGTVKVQLPWDRIAVAGVFALGVLLIVVAAVNEKWLKGSSGKVFDRGPQQVLTVEEGSAPKTPKLDEAAAKGTHVPPAGASDDAATTDTDPDETATKDVKLKGKNVGEN